MVQPVDRGRQAACGGSRAQEKQKSRGSEMDQRGGSGAGQSDAGSDSVDLEGQGYASPPPVASGKVGTGT